MKQINPEQIIITGIEDEKGQRHYFSFIINLYKRFFYLTNYQELIRNLVIRELKVRYKNSILGIMWSLLNPLLMMMVFTVVFTVMAPVTSTSLSSFPVFILCGLLPWNFFASSVISSTSTMVRNAPLLKKVYFPLEILPLSEILANLINFLIALIILFGMIIIFRVNITIWLIYLPLLFFIQLLFILGVGFFLSTANVFYRDTQQIMDILMLAWFFMTPIFYPISILPRNYELFGISFDVQRLVYIVNPMASIIATYRDILYYGVQPGSDFLARTAVTTGVIFLLGWLVFNHYSWRFAEEL